jgi:hypothetical protein
MKSLGGQTLNTGTTMTLKEVAVALSGNLNGKWINVRGPGHTSGDHSLGFRFDSNAPDGFSLKSLASDDPATCRAHVKHLLGKIAADGPLAIEYPAEADDEIAAQMRHDASIKVWNEAVPAQGTLVEAYLTARGCKLTEAAFTADVLRFHPLCPFGADRVPAMVALMTDVISGERRGIHRTAVKDDGSGKRTMPDGMPVKMMLGPAKGAVVMLQPRGPRLGIAEGVETAFSAQEIFKIPVWAAMSAQGIKAFPIIHGLKQLTIFADHDKPGLEAAYKCGRRYAAAGIEAAVRYPSKKGADWNDYLLNRWS